MFKNFMIIIVLFLKYVMVKIAKFENKYKKRTKKKKKSCPKK